MSEEVTEVENVEIDSHRSIFNTCVPLGKPLGVSLNPIAFKDINDKVFPLSPNSEQCVYLQQNVINSK
jgi:hypothetical protein